MTRYDDPWTITDDIMDMDDGVDLAPPSEESVWPLLGGESDDGGAPVWFYIVDEDEDGDGLNLEWWSEDDAQETT